MSFRNATVIGFIFFCLFQLHAQSPNRKLIVTVGNFYPVRGNLMLYVFDSTVSNIGSENANKAIRKIVMPVISPRIRVMIDSLPKGNYAIEVLHDENANGRFEFTNEDYSFSGRGNGMGPPKFKQAVIYFDGTSAHLNLSLENELASRSSSYETNVAFSPVFGYAPETNALLGANMIRLFKHKGSDSLTRTSYLDVLAIGTLNKQLIVEQNYLFFTRQEKFLFNGFTGYSRFPQYYYGVGGQNNTNQKDVVNYQQFRFEHLAMKKIYGKVFAGIGYRYNKLFKLTYNDSSRLALTPTAGDTGAASSGVQFAIASDYRNNVYNTSSGHLIKIKSTINRKGLGSQYTYRVYEADLRQFIRPFHQKQDVIALQAYGYFSDGDVPWNEMGALGSDMIMRGYYSGRYRDKQYVAAQVEYRHPFNKMFGIVAFAGAGEVAAKTSALSAQQLKPNVGTGFRMTIDRRERLNLRLDIGFGKNTSNVYFTIAEAF